MIDSNKARQLYDLMVRSGSGVESIGYDKFASGLEDDTKRRQVYDYIRSKDRSMTLDYDRFSSGLGANPIAETRQSAPINDVAPTMQTMTEPVAETPVPSVSAPIEPQPEVKQKKDRTVATVVGGRPTLEQSKAYARRIGTDDQLPLTKEEMDKKKEEDAKNDMANIEWEVRDKLAQGANLEDVNRYLATLYKETTNPKARNNIRDAQNSLYQGRIAEVGKQVEAAKEAAQKKQADKTALLREWSDIMAPNQSNIEEWKRGRDEYFRSKGREDLIGYDYNSDIETAQRLYNETVRLSNWSDKAHEGDRGDGWANVGRGIANQVLTGTTWSFGLTDAADAGLMMRIKDKMDSGQELDETEQAIAAALSLNSEFQEAIGGVLPHGFKAGQTGGAAIPFVVQMGINPAGGLGIKLESAAVKKAIKGEITKAGRGLLRSRADDVALRQLDNMVDLTANQRREIYSKLLKDYGLEGVGSVMTSRYGSRVLGDLASASILATTIQAPTSTKNVMERYLGDIVDNGDGTFTVKDNESLGGAVVHGVGSQVVEDFTEMMGEWGLGHYAKRLASGAAGKAGAKGLAEGIDKLGTGRVMQFFDAYANGAGRKMTLAMERMGFDGFVPEVMEEEYGIVLHSLIGDGEANISELKDADTQLDIILGIGLFSGAMGAVKMGGSGYSHAKYKHDLNQVDSENQGRSADWVKTRDAINVASNNELGKLLYDIAKRKKDGKSTEMDDMMANYIEKLMPYRGSSIMREIFDYTPEQRNVRKAFDRGFSRKYSNKVRQEYEHERAKMEIVYRKDVLDLIDANAQDIVARLGTKQQMTDSQGLIDYLNAKAAYDGCMQSMGAEIDNDIAKATGMIMATNNGGRQIRVENNKGEQMYIISGDVETDEEGNVIHNGSTSLVVMLENGQRKMVDSKSIVKVISDQSTDELIAEVDANIRQAKLAEFTDEVFGRIRPEVGATYTIMQDGQAVDATVNGYGIDANGNNLVNVTTPSGTTDMALDVFQDAYAESSAREVVAEAEQRNEERSLEVGMPVMSADGVRGVITSTPDADGKYTISWDSPVNGKMADALTADEFLPYDEQMQREILAKNAAPVEEKAEEPVEETKEEPVAKTDPEEEEYTNFIAKHGEKSGKKVETTLAEIDKRIKSESEKLAKLEEKADNAPEPLDDADVQAEQKLVEEITSQRAKVEELTKLKGKYTRFQERINTPAKDILAPEESIPNPEYGVNGTGMDLSSDASKISTKEMLRQMGEPMTWQDYVLFGATGWRFIWDNSKTSATKGLGAHLTGRNSHVERKSRIGWLANKDKGGNYPEVVAENIYNNMPEWLMSQCDSQDIFNLILDTVLGYSSGQQAIRDIYIARQQAARSAFDDEVSAMRDDFAQRRGFADWQEYNTFEDAVSQGEIFHEIPENEITEYYNTIYGDNESASPATGVSGMVEQSGEQERLDGQGNQVGQAAETTELGGIAENGQTGSAEVSSPVVDGEQVNSSPRSVQRFSSAEEFLLEASGVNRMAEEQWIRRSSQALADYNASRQRSKERGYGKRLQQARDKVKGIVAETLDKVSDREVNVIDRDNFIDVMRQANPNNEDGIDKVRESMAIESARVNGFLSGGHLYINADDMRSVDDIVSTFAHERSHADVLAGGESKALTDMLASGADRTMIDAINVGISDDVSYLMLDDASAADEALAHMQQRMYFGQSAEEVLAELGIKDDTLASLFNDIYNGQQRNDGYSKTGRYAHIIHDSKVGTSQNGADTQARPAEVGEQRGGSATGSAEVTPIEEGEDYLDYADRVAGGKDGAKSDSGTRFSTAYHGSAAKFDKFDTKFIGTGEGNQAYGWGTYVTTNKETGKKYAGIAAAENSFNGRLKRNNKDDIVTWINDKMEYDPLLTFDEAKQMVRAEIEMDETVASVKASEVDDITQEYAKEHGYRNLYTVDIPDDNGENYLHWDKPLTKIQSKNIADAVLAVPQVKEDYGENAESEVRNAFNGINGSQVEGTLDYFLGKDIDYATGVDKNAEKKAKMLYGLGIVGMQVDIDRNGGNRYAGSNYVLYNPDDVKITDHTMFSTTIDKFDAFYSNAAKALEGIQQNKATAEQWLAMLQKNGGLKAGEDKWLGLGDWLKSKSGAVTKAEIEEYIAKNAIKVEEVKYGGNDEVLNDLQVYLRDAAQEGVNLDDYDTLIDILEEYDSHYGTEYAYKYQSPESKLEIDKEGNITIGGERLTKGVNPINDTRLGYTSNGLTNKREIALTVPTIEPYTTGNLPEVHFADDATNDKAGEAAMNAYKEWLGDHPTRPTGSDDVKRMMVLEGLSNEDAQTLEDNNLTMEGGVIMNKEAQQLKHETGYLTPNETMFSRTTWKNTGRESYLNRLGARKEVVSVLDNLASWLVANELIDEFTPKGEHKTVGTGDRGPLRTNVEYVFTFDVDTTCPRTFQQLQYVKQIEKKIGRPLSQLELVQLNELMRAYGQQIPCVYCYAENKRQAKKQYMLNYIKARRNVISTEDEAEARKLMYGQSKSKDSINGLTKAANEVFTKWRSKRGGYNPDIEELFAEYNKMRDIILTILDDMKGDMKLDDMSAIKVQNLLIKKLDLTGDAGRAAYDIAAEWLWDAVEGRNHKDFTRTEGDINQDALAVWKQMTDYANSASGAKSVLTYVPYTDELAKLPQETKDYINGMGGLRMHSTNDFRIDYLFDYLQLIADMEQAGMLGHTYTKSPDFVRIFGKTGYRINMSIAAYEDENGNIIENEQEGFNWHTAQELRDAFENAGVMMMATSDKQLQFALDADWIDMIIPFHHSGLDKRFWKDMRAWMDYTSKQTERFLTKKDMMVRLKAKGVDVSNKMSAKEIEKLFLDKCGIKIAYDKDGKRIKPHFLPGQTIKDGNVIPGHGNNVQEYFRLCEEWGVTPRFQGIKVKDAQGKEIYITKHPGYIKLLKETARTDTPQQAVKFNLNEHNDYLGTTPIEYAKKLLEDQAKIGYEYPDNYGVVDTFIKEYIDNPKPMVYLPENARVTWREQNSVLRKTYGAWMKNDNAIPYHPATMLSTSVTPEQDNAYMDAVKAGDMAKAQQMVRDAFKAAFPDTQVVDENEEPLVVYHTTNDDIVVFDRNRLGRNTMANNIGDEDGGYAQTSLMGFWFNTHKIPMIGTSSIPVFLNIDVMYDGDSLKTLASGIESEGGADIFRSMLESDGYNGLWISDEEFGGNSYVAFNPNQIKSAEPVTYDDNGEVIPLSQRFNPENNDIRFSIAGVNGMTSNDSEESRARLANLQVARDMEKQLNPNWKAKEDADALKIKVATGWERGADGLWRYEIPDAKFKDGVFSRRWGGKTTLKDIVDAPDIFSLYPKIGDVKVKRLTSNKIGGTYSESENTITINTALVTWALEDIKEIEDYYDGEIEAIKSNQRYVRRQADLEKYIGWNTNTLNHEIQHAIQRIEGFARGGNSYMSYNGRKLGEEGYHALGGEVESRNTTYRSKMTDEERRNTLLATTEDVAREDQIFIMNGLGKADTRFSIVGQKAAQKLDAVMGGTRMVDLFRAKSFERQGKSSKLILAMTGWQKGVDGKWRMEVPDILLKDNYLEAKTVGEIAKDNELFQAYPDLKNIRVKMVPGDESGSFDRDTKEITIGSFDKESVRDILIHELQHYIQSEEEFARGGSDYEFVTPDNPGFNVPTYIMEETLEMLKVLKNVPRDITVEQAQQAYKDAKTKAEKDAYILVIQVADAGGSIEELYQEEKKDYKRLHDLIKYNLTDMNSPYWKYLRLAGETEARNAQYRSAVPFADRVKMLFEETADVAAKDQIILFENAKSNFEEEVRPMVRGIGKSAGTRFSVSTDKGRSRSAYDNGKVTVYNPYDGIDVQAGVMRESFTNRDIRSLDGWEDFTDTARRMGNTEVSRRAMYNGWDFDAAVESWIYDNADRMVPAFETLLHRNGIDLGYRMTPEELRMYLTRVNDYLDRADVESMKADLKTEPKVMFSTTFQADAQKIYEAVEASRWAKFQRGWVDGTNAVKHLQDAILAETGHSLSDFEDAHTFLNQIGSRSQAEFDEYTLRFIDPIINVMRELTGKNGICSESDFLVYLMCKHGLERNEVFARRDAEKEWDLKNTEQQREINKLERMQSRNGMLSPEHADELEAMKDEKRNIIEEYYNEKRERDYSGLTSIFNVESVGEAEMKAMETVADFEQRMREEKDFAPDDLWKRINAATKQTLKTAYEAGQLTKDNYHKIASMFEYYIPLRGFDETTSDEVYDYYNHSGVSVGPVVRNARGRVSIAANPIANIMSMAQAAIFSANKNKAKQKLLNFVENNTTKLAVIDKTWYVNEGTPDEPDWQPRYPHIPANANADDVSIILANFRAEMEKKKLDGMATQNPEIEGMPKKGYAGGYRTINKADEEHMIPVMRGGEQYLIFINGNPKAAQAINGLINPESKMSPEGKLWRKMQRIYAAMLTSLAPNFAITNGLRDRTFARLSVLAKEDAKYALQFEKNMWKTLGRFGLVSKTNRGTLDERKELEKYYKEFVANGGETGFTRVLKEREMEKVIRQMLEPNAIQKVWKFMTGWVEYLNHTIENQTRFATFMTSRQQGRGIQQSIADAKNITANFNRKGSGEYGQGAASTFYMFVNAAVQSLVSVNSAAGLTTGLKKNADGTVSYGINVDKKRLSKMVPLLAGVALQGFLFSMIAAMAEGGDGDDDGLRPYDLLSDYEKKNHVIIPAGNGKFIKMPLGMEFRAFYGLGNSLFDIVTGRSNESSLLSFAKSLASTLPINVTEQNGLVPDVAAPLWEAYIVNRNFAGLPVYKEGSSALLPEYQRVYKGTWQFLVNASKFWSEAGGSTETTRAENPVFEVNPAKVQHVIEGYGGGVMTFLIQMENMLEDVISLTKGEETKYTVRNVPFLNRVMVATESRNDNSRVKNLYYENCNKAQLYRRRAKDYLNAMTTTFGTDAYDKANEQYQEFYESPEYRMTEIVKQYSKAVESFKEIGDEEMMIQYMREMNSRIRELYNKNNEEDKNK